jgi:selenocysteine lyase/cysteine desulfurase
MRQPPRDLFDYPESIYLLNHSVGRPPRSTAEALRAGYLEPWQQAGEEVWPRWLDNIDHFRLALGALLDADPGGFCPQANLSSALTKIVLSRAVDPQRPVLLCTEHDFPSMVFVLERAQRFGFELRIIRGQGGELLDVDTWKTHLSRDVGSVLISHVHSNSGRQVPVAEITALTRERNILSIVDIAQSVGCLPISLAGWHADFVLGSCVKWLCGGPGAGFLWAGPEAIADSEPGDVGWFSHEDPFEFDIDQFRYAPDALRFWGGTPSVAPFVVAANSIALINEIGVQSIREHNIRMCDILCDALPAAELACPTDPALRGATLVVKPGESRAAKVTAALRAKSVDFDQRASGLRLSPHIYNTRAEMETVGTCLQG